MAKDYVWLKPVSKENAARFKAIKNFDEDYLLADCVSLVDEFPENAEIRMNDDFPDNIGLYDTHFVIGDIFIASERLMKYIKNGDEKNVEFFPIKVLNHKGREVKEKYFVVNILNLVDCIVKEKTTYKTNSLNEDMYIEVKNLHIDETKIDKKFILFRIKHLNYNIVVQRKFAQDMLAQGFKYFELFEVEQIEGN